MASRRASRLFVPYGTDPQPGSVGESEITTFSHPESVHTAQSQAWILI